jgi:hypothetical protein
MNPRRALDAWKASCAEAKARAERRWEAIQKLERPDNNDWFDATSRRMAQFAKAEILGPHEHSRLKKFDLGELEAPDRDRLGTRVANRRHLVAFGVARDPAAPEEPLRSRSLRLNDGPNVREGKLTLQVFIDLSTKLPVGMNIQIRGLDPHRDRPCYLRYDLDPVPLGSGPVTHFSSHWHVGDDPDAAGAEDHDPRLPSLILDPISVLDVLVETFFPKGPAD